MNLNNISSIADKYSASVIKNAKMSNFTSFKIGGECDCLIKINSEECLIEIINCCKKENIPYYILGKGTNVLISDSGLKGVVLLISCEFSNAVVNGETITCEAGTTITTLCNIAKENSLTGLEFAYGIPGTVGGALYMNAGAFFGEMKDVVASCRYIDENMELKEINVDKMDLSYRHSIFSEKGYPITSVTIKLQKGEKENILDRMETLMQRRKDRQPLEYPSAGSTFKRPKGDFAARLIEECGLKGTCCGGAEVSTKHSGFIINKGNATFKDVISVVEIVKERVYKDTGIMLECEVLIME